MNASAAVLVVGAGPAGSALGWFLAQRGVDVQLVDRAAWPRDKICGDGLSPRALGILQTMGLLEDVVAAGWRVNRVSLYAPNGRRLAGSIPSEPGGLNFLVILPRLQLDDMLRRRATDAGATFHEQFQVGGFIEEQGRVVGVRATTPSGPVELRARTTVLATGAAAHLLGKAGLANESRAVGAAARAYFDDVTTASDEVEFHFDGVPLPGYSWLFPTGPTSANIGAGHFARRPSAQPHIRTVFEQALAAPGLRAHLAGAQRRGPMQGFPLRFGFASAPLARPGLLVVGEAAGLVNPLSGEGIDLALESAQVTAEQLADALAAGMSPEQLAERHALALRGRFLRRFQAMSWVRWAYFRRFTLDRLAAAAERYADLRRLLVDVALSGSSPATAFQPRVLRRILLG